MTLDEAIKRYTDNAEYERTHGSLQGCMDFRQLAEWLKDYKRLKEQEPKTGHWIQLDYQRGMFECSECHTQGYVDTEMYKPTWVACPRCGARMESEVRNE